MAKRNNFYGLDEPLKLNCHGRPKTRREMLGQGFRTGLGTVAGASIFSMFADPHKAFALSADIDGMKTACGITGGAGKIPFICFDLAGGANMAGSNVLVGGGGGQMDFLGTNGYSKQGLPGDMVPGLTEGTPTATSNGDFTDTSFGLAFHSDSGFLTGMLEKTAVATRAATNGTVIAARSENDTGNNPHNPMYAMNMAGANGELLALIGSQSSDSGGRSMAPAMMINNEVRPTKVDRPSDVTGLVDVGDFGELEPNEVVAVLESITRISNNKLNAINPLTNTTNSEALRRLVRCGYVKNAYLSEIFPNPDALDPAQDTDIVGDTGIFTQAEFDSDREFRKTASVMKLVVNGFAGAGTVAMGGYDYHTGDRATGEVRDQRVGRCIGACLEYAARMGKPLMVYVFTDGSVFSNGTTDNSIMGRGKGVWTGDNQQTSSAFFLVHNPSGRPQLVSPTMNQIGSMSSGGDVDTSSSPAGNNVNLLVQTVMLNYMALHGETGMFEQAFTDRGIFHGLGNSQMMDSLTAFTPIVNSVITDPIALT